MLAVIQTGGKQYLVTPGQKIKIDPPSPRLRRARKIKEGDEITFSDVLLSEKENKIEIGTPLVKGTKVVGKVIRQGKGKKVIIFKYRAKTRYKKKTGHRQPFTEVEITKITSGD